MAGAGISTAAGIPDFRSPKTGFYNSLAEHYTQPEDLFKLEFFKDNPAPFFFNIKGLLPGQYKPTASHYFIRLLHEKGVLLRHYTQNIDSLEILAGIPEEKVVEAHGTFRTSHCMSCKKEYKLDWLKAQLATDDKDFVPKCRCCKGIVKPDTTFFGEDLPERFYSCTEVDFPACDLLIILGTSLVVHPFASQVDKFV
ncbi:NAD-dependent protein deacetylase Sirt2-like [Cloeon dipterum]|uniref:NAD-dependent protein deacetylase Sirt2-like n=1 Tax=Cloeon dipterum TaxID=197152 RepID=UPI0032202A83